jgi:superfamily I DNA and/or RNA helicase
MSRPCPDSPQRVPVDGKSNHRFLVHNIQPQHSLTITELNEQFGSADNKPAPTPVLLTYSTEVASNEILWLWLPDWTNDECISTGQPFKICSHIQQLCLQPAR